MFHAARIYTTASLLCKQKKVRHEEKRETRELKEGIKGLRYIFQAKTVEIENGFVVVRV